ncbi:interaptin-like [Labrus bergylta]|uniref:interaptin-like n=1 Tax=Labrus bergylta TaxID=56723 RepID=UPI0033140444
MEYYRSQRRADTMEMGAHEFRNSMPGANSRGHQQSHNRQHPAQPKAQTFHQRREGASLQHQWPKQDGPHRPSHQGRPPQRQVVADLKNEVQGLSFLIKQEKELNKPGSDRDMLSKDIVQESEERLKIEHDGRLESKKEIRILKDELKHMNSSFSIQQDMSNYSTKTKEELIGVIAALNQKLQDTASSDPKLDQDLRAEKEALVKKLNDMQQETFSRDIKTANQTRALKNQLEEMTSRCHKLSFKLTAKEEENQNLQKKVQDLQKEMEEVTHQHLEIVASKVMLVDHLTEENKSLEHEMEAMKKEVFNNEMLKAEQLESLKSSCLELSSKLTAQEETNQALQNIVEDLQMQEEDQRMRAVCLEKELEDTRFLLVDTAKKGLLKIEGLKEEKSSLKQDMKAMQKEAMLKGKQLQGLQNQLQEQTSRCLGLSSNLTAQEETNQTLQEKVEDLKLQEEHQRMRAVCLEKELEDTRFLLVDTAKKGLLKIEGLKEEKSSLKQDMKAMQKEAMLKGKQLQGLQNQLQEQTSRCLGLSSNLTAQEETNQTLQEKVEDLKLQEEHQSLRADGLENELEVVRLQHVESANKDLLFSQALTEEKSSLEQDMKAMQIEAMLKGKQLQGLQNQLQEQTSRCLELSSIITAQREITQTLQEKVEDLKLQEEHQRLRADGLENELEVVRLQHVESANKDLLFSQALTEEKSSLEQDMKAMQKDAMLKGKQLQGLQNQLQEQTSRCLELSSIITAQREITQTLQEKVEDLKLQEEHQRLRADDLENELEVVRLQHVESANKDLLFSQALTEEKSSLEQDMKAMQKEAMLKGKQLQGLQNQLQEQTSRCLELSSIITAQKETTQTLQEKVEDLKLQEEHQRLRADGLENELEVVRLQHVESANKDLLFSQALKEEKSSLEQDMKAMQIEAMLKGKQLQGLQNQLQEQTSRCLELSSKLTAEEEANQVLEEKVEVLQNEMRQQPSEQEEISLWRKLKKSFTPASRRKFKQQNKQMLDQM